MRLRETKLGGVTVIESLVAGDNRGSFSRVYCENELRSVIGDRRIAQINRSLTHTVGAIRGLHFQYPPKAEMKLVICLKGRIFDVAVDLRAKSPTFLRWHADELSADNALIMVIPEGCAHGFQVLEGGSELLYLHTEFYSSEAEGGILWNDPRVGIEWPLPLAEISERDRDFRPIGVEYTGFVL